MTGSLGRARFTSKLNSSSAKAGDCSAPLNGFEIHMFVFDARKLQLPACKKKSRLFIRVRKVRVSTPE